MRTCYGVNVEDIYTITKNKYRFSQRTLHISAVKKSNIKGTGDFGHKISNFLGLFLNVLVVKTIIKQIVATPF